MISPEEVRVRPRKEDEMHLHERGVAAEELFDGRGGHARGLFARVAERARRDRREGHALKPALGGQRERVAIARRQQLSLAPALKTPDRPDRVNHTARGQKARGRDDGLARGQPFGVERAPNLQALFKYARPARAVYRAVDTAAAQETAVGRVHDGVRSQTRDVADGDAD